MFFCTTPQKHRETIRQTNINISNHATSASLWNSPSGFPSPASHPSKTARNAAIALAARTGTPITWVGEAGPGGDELEDAIALSLSRARRRHQPMP
jgi:hypothetical protein